MIEKYLTKTQLDKLKAKGINYKQLTAWALERFDLPYRKNTDQFEVTLINGTFILPQGIFEPYECPICGKKELRAYYLCASPTSGGHIIRTYCSGCKEYISLHDTDFYYKVRNYVFENKKDLKRIPSEWIGSKNNKNKVTKTEETK